MKKFKNTFINSLISKRSKIFTLIVIFGAAGLLSFTSGIFENQFADYFVDNPEAEIAYTDTELKSDYKFYLENTPEDVLEEVICNPFCPAGVRSFPVQDPGSQPEYPFHRATGINVQSITQGNCFNGGTPCSFVGHIAIVTGNGQTGDYQIITPNGIIDLPNTSGLVNVPFGTSTNPFLVNCSFFEDIIVQAKNPTTGAWEFVRRFRFICLPCCIEPTGV